MTNLQKALKSLRERQSRERGRMAELAVSDGLTDETRAEMDELETGTADLERQLRAAQAAVDLEEAEQRTAAPGHDDDGDAEDREIRELRSKVKLSGYVSAAIEQRAADGAEAEYNAARNIAGNRFPLELLVPPINSVRRRNPDLSG